MHKKITGMVVKYVFFILLLANIANGLINGSKCTQFYNFNFSNDRIKISLYLNLGM